MSESSYINSPLRIATRDSPLAVWQARRVGELLRNQEPRLQIDLEYFKAVGDVNLGPIMAVGESNGVGIFTKVLDEALLQKHADIAVHSFKDYPTDHPEELKIAAVPERGPIADVLVVREDDLASDDETAADFLRRLTEAGGSEEAAVGTSSPRRQAQLQRLAPRARFAAVRGNVGTRLRKLHEGQYGALMMAAAGLERLGVEQCPELVGLRALKFDPIDEVVPAPAQGALCVTCRADDDNALDLLAKITRRVPRATALAERAALYHLGGGCFIPIGATAHVLPDTTSEMELHAVVTSPPILEGEERDSGASEDSSDGCVPDLIHTTMRGTARDPEELGRQVAERLLELGAGELIKGYRPPAK